MILAILLLVGLLLLSLRTCSSDQPSSNADSDVNSEAGESIVRGSAPPATNTVTFDGKTYNLEVMEPCGYRADGQFGLLAVTIDDAGETEETGAQFLVQSSPWETVADFYTGAGDVHRVSQRGSKRMSMEDERLSFSGKTDGANSSSIRIDLACN